MAKLLATTQFTVKPLVLAVRAMELFWHP